MPLIRSCALTDNAEGSARCASAARSSLFAADWRRLRARWPQARRSHVSMEVDDPFLTVYPQNLLRDGRVAEVCYLLYRGQPQAGILLHTKSYYPKQAYRLPTGGLAPGEDPVAGVVREVAEETGLEVWEEPAELRTGCIADFAGLLTYNIRHRHLDRELSFATFMFAIQAPDDMEPQVIDEIEQIAGWAWCPPDDLYRIAANLCGLKDSTPDWADWGRFRAVVHTAAARYFETRGPSGVGNCRPD
ncbi:MAG: NUDIX hydrolase [Caldilineaceae bacterium SB0661_bin_34]|nr:NUDIX hydrolase [Caldilineaceae bacterium SB0661_bin_34]